MSKIVLGLATSHSPLLTFGADVWSERAKDDVKMSALTLSDGRTLSYADLQAERGDRFADEARPEVFERQDAAAQANLDRLADELEAAGPDIVLIVGDDQEELFGAGTTPAVAIYHGEDMVMHPLSQVRPNLPEWRMTASEGYRMDQPYRYPAAPDYARGLIERLMDAEVDLTVSAQVSDPHKAGFGHAYGFVVGRLFRGRTIPVVPLLLNTYYPPNVPSAERCHDIGRLLRSAIEASPDDLRVCVVASGGLSHFVTDADLDGGVMDALETADAAHLRSIPRGALRSGSSEILNWIMAAGALEGLPLAWRDYIPVYRTPVGTGVGLGFACWRA